METFAEMEFGVQLGYNNCERKGLKAELGKRRALLQACSRGALEQGLLVRVHVGLKCSAFIPALVWAALGRQLLKDWQLGAVW